MQIQKRAIVDVSNVIRHNTNLDGVQPTLVCGLDALYRFLVRQRFSVDLLGDKGLWDLVRNRQTVVQLCEKYHDHRSLRLWLTYGQLVTCCRGDSADWFILRRAQSYIDRGMTAENLLIVSNDCFREYLNDFEFLSNAWLDDGPAFVRGFAIRNFRMTVNGIDATIPVWR